jgi:hypothetical protein
MVQNLYLDDYYRASALDSAATVSRFLSDLGLSSGPDGRIFSPGSDSDPAGRSLGPDQNSGPVDRSLSPGKPLTRRELAVLIDSILDPFHDRSVDLCGVLQDPNGERRTSGGERRTSDVAR